ncbi:hypothetical protein B0H14DRAFT_2589070 [Mycena olivaceomarginata]|nr:hypothetical protein B0H14DRAFT_2589070 [Mycena olivaceomarginata]
MAFDYNGRRDPLAYAYRRRWGPHSRGGFRGSSSTEGTACLYRRGLRGTRSLETGTTTSGRNSWQQGASIRANRGFGSCGDGIGIQIRIAFASALDLAWFEKIVYIRNPNGSRRDIPWREKRRTNAEQMGQGSNRHSSAAKVRHTMWTRRSCTGFNPVKEGGTNIAGPQAVVEIQDRCNGQMQEKLFGTFGVYMADVTAVNPKGVEPDRMCVLSRKGNHRVEELDGMRLGRKGGVWHWNPRENFAPGQQDVMAGRKKNGQTRNWSGTKIFADRDSDSEFEYSLQFYAVGAIIELMQRRLRREMKTWGADRNFIWSSREIAQILGESDRLALKWILV